MAATRLSVSFDQDLAEVVRQSAGQSSEAISTWLAEAARRRVKQDSLLGAIADFEQEYGLITDAELEASRLRLGITASSSGVASAGSALGSA